MGTALNKTSVEEEFPSFDWISLEGIEKWREYTFANGEKIRIENPVSISISENGHRVATNALQYYIPKGWILLTFNGTWLF